MSNDPYVFTPCPTSGGDLDLSSLRGCAIADAAARFRAAGGRDALLGTGLDTGVARAPLEALEIAIDWTRQPAIGDPAVERWAQWLIEKLDAAKLIYHRVDGGWRLRTGKLHEENERRLGELDGWSKAGLAGQRDLLAHVDDPGDSGSELEQSLSKLAASGWKVDAKKDKGPPEVHFAAGDMPLAQGDDWRAPGTVHPRLAAALAFFLTAVPPAERESAQPGETAAIAARLPAIAVTDADDSVALLDIRTIAKALRDVGTLDLPSGEPLGPVVVHESFKLRAPRTGAETTPAPPNGGDPAAAPPAAVAAAAAANDPVALIASHDPEAVRFALLYAAAPGKRFRGGEDVVGYAAAFLARLREFATARLDGTVAGQRIEPGDGLRRRLAGWCDTAVSRTAENHERLDMHRATRNAIALLKRIEDFDARVGERGDGADREAIAVALTVLAQLLAPLAPRAAGDLWRQAGRDGSPADAAWPSAQREPAAA